jgi:probable F420-dependent oxidoreductase
VNGRTRISLQAFGLRAEVFAEVARTAERRGFDTLWLSEHLVTPLERDSVYPYSPTGRAGYAEDTPLPDVLVTAGHLAAVTTKLRIGTGVYILPLRHPVHVARSVETVQALAGGRFTFGIGSGWLREEYDAGGAEFRRRGARMDEMLEIMSALWSGEPVAHRGAFYSFAAIQLAPPARRVPIYVGGMTTAALERAARIGDGWFGPACSLDDAVTARRTIEAARERHGREEPFDFAVRLEGPPTREAVERFAEMGFGHVVVSLASVGLDRDAAPDAVERIADAVAA